LDPRHLETIVEEPHMLAQSLGPETEPERAVEKEKIEPQKPENRPGA
jgi:hypothetical protein